MTTSPISNSYYSRGFESGSGDKSGAPMITTLDSGGGSSPSQKSESSLNGGGGGTTETGDVVVFAVPRRLLLLTAVVLSLAIGTLAYSVSMLALISPTPTPKPKKQQQQWRSEQMFSNWRHQPIERSIFLHIGKAGGGEFCDINGNCTAERNQIQEI